MLGVGLVGAGLATQAIHVPTIASLPDQLRVVHVTDVDATRAQAVAARTDARASTSLDELLADPAVDVVGICTPAAAHAAQILAACEAGKRAVLCEKPLTMDRDEAAAIRLASERHGVPVLVGTMNLWDPATRAAFSAAGELRSAPLAIRSTILIPPNEALIDLATDRVQDCAPAAIIAPRAWRPGSVDDEVAHIRRTILALAVHGLALVRRLMPGQPEVTFVRALEPWGYLVVLSGGGRVARLTGMLGVEWDPEWTFEAVSPDAVLRLDFPPSYVQAGSAVARLRQRGEERVWQFAESGFQAQWRHVAAVATGAEEPAMSVADAVDDVVFALDVVDSAVHWLRQNRAADGAA